MKRTRSIAQATKEDAIMYRPSREESENAILMLVQLYPKCFFEDPKLRRPQKKGIVSDLEADGCAMARELIVAAVEWYQSHFGYLASIQPGAKRIDLNGKEVGTVTAQEAANARKKEAEGREKRAALLNNSTRTNLALHASGRVPDDQLRKLDAPKVTVGKRVEPPLDAALTELGANNDLRAELEAIHANVTRHVMALSTLGIKTKTNLRDITQHFITAQMLLGDALAKLEVKDEEGLRK